MKVYHISLNEYANYALTSEFFTSWKDVEKWVRHEAKGIVDLFDRNGKRKSVRDIIYQYNECQERGIILDECEIENGVVVEEPLRKSQ
jgi:hypothetical protein